MARKQPALDAQTINAAVKLARGLPPKVLIGLVVVALVGAAVYFGVTRMHTATAATTPGGGTPGGGTPGGGTPGSGPATTDRDSLLFCWWNVENLFDDRPDKRNSIDREFDGEFSGNEHLRNLKYDRIASTLVKMNQGRGPDVLAICEVESPRAAELLMAAMNKKLDDAKVPAGEKYANVIMKDLDGGRHIAPAIITKFAVNQSATRLHGNRLRILEGHVVVNGHDLTVLATHWTSKLPQKDGGNGESGRFKYADTSYEVFRAAAKKDRACDFILCGDFNDTPDSEAVVDHLGATGDRKLVVPTDDRPRLLDLLAGKDAAKFGTLFYSGKPLIYDHVCLSPGMLDAAGWSADPDTVLTATEGLMRKGATRREPFRFESPGKDLPDDKRGFSDHFPVTVRLKVAKP